MSLIERLYTIGAWEKSVPYREVKHYWGMSFRNRGIGKEEEKLNKTLLGHRKSVPYREVNGA